MDISLKRIVAYILDIIFITMFVTILTNIKIINPHLKAYNENYQIYNELNEAYKNDEITTEEYKEKMIHINYELSKSNIVTASLTIGAFIIYFGILQKILGGVTFGKNIMKIRLVSQDEKPLGTVNYLLRTIILNNIILRVLLISGVFFLNEKTYYDYTAIISFIESTIESILFAMIILRKDHRGLHDILSHTKVIEKDA